MTTPMNTEHGLCQCGCGQKTPLATETNRSRNQIKGQPMRYIFGHVHTKYHGPDYVVLPNGCWQWQKSISPTGYGRYSVKRMPRYAHRKYFEDAYGVIPAGMEIDHLCRNRACVNPAHLQAVPKVINVRRGAATKLNDQQVSEIKLRYCEGESKSALSRYFSISRAQVSVIVNGKGWKTVMDIVCCCCHKITGTKDGHGQTGTTSTICPACALKLLPTELHAEYHRRKQLEREGFTVSADRIAMGRSW